MTALHETAYPRLRSNLTAQALRELYTPTPEEMVCVQQVTSAPVTALGVAVLRKTFQRLGDFPAFETLPPRLMAHLAGVMGTPNRDDLLRQYEANGYRWRHGPLMRTYLHVKAFREGGRRVLLRAMLEAAQSKDMLADLINVGIEALVQVRYELPACSTLRRAAQKARAQVNGRYDPQVAAALNDLQRATIARLLTREAQEATSLWQRLKRAPKHPTTKRIREPITHARWLQSLNRARQAIEGIPETTLQRFAEAARALDTSRMQAMQAATRVTLAVALIRVQTALALDDLAEMCIRRLQKLHPQANDALADDRRQHQEQADAFIALLGQIVSDWQASPTPVQRLQAVDALIGTERTPSARSATPLWALPGTITCPAWCRSSRPIASSSWIAWRVSDRRRPGPIRRWSRRSP